MCFAKIQINYKNLTFTPQKERRRRLKLYSLALRKKLKMLNFLLITETKQL